MSKTNSNAPSPGNIIGETYQLHRKIGNGSFGDIYLGTDLQSGKNVAVKLESK